MKSFAIFSRPNTSGYKVTLSGSSIISVIGSKNGDKNRYLDNIKKWLKAAGLSLSTKSEQYNLQTVLSNIQCALNKISEHDAYSVLPLDISWTIQNHLAMCGCCQQQIIFDVENMTYSWMVFSKTGNITMSIHSPKHRSLEENFVYNPNDDLHIADSIIFQAVQLYNFIMQMHSLCDLMDACLLVPELVLSKEKHFNLNDFLNEIQDEIETGMNYLQKVKEMKISLRNELSTDLVLQNPDDKKVVNEQLSILEASILDIEQKQCFLKSEIDSGCDRIRRHGFVVKKWNFLPQSEIENKLNALLFCEYDENHWEKFIQQIESMINVVDN